ncbi:MAG TPA: NADH-quinone oxidoreductase subunit D, partial [Acidimicrobiaceae bacterium]|nr:NADH-quinone oxidoreductase subunit D [Acidimicrobiaceae bacterium]
GTRLTTSYTRIGGVFRDLPEDFDELAKNIVEEFRSFLEEMRSMTIGNRIFEDRMRGVGVIRGEDAINWGITGPILRASG